MQTPKPLDSRSVVNTIEDLYAFKGDPYIYEGMVVACQGTLYTLKDVENVDNEKGWVTSFNSNKLIYVTKEEYDELVSNDKIDSDAYYYIKEESDGYYVSGEQFEAKLASMQESINNKAQISSLNNYVKTVDADDKYLTKEDAKNTYLPSSTFSGSTDFVKLPI